MTNSKKPPHHHYIWTEEEDQLLLKLSKEDYTHGKIGEILGRTHRSVESRLFNLKGRPNTPPRKCQYCHKMFTPKKYNIVYCSQNCRDECQLIKKATRQERYLAKRKAKQESVGRNFRNDAIYQRIMEAFGGPA